MNMKQANYMVSIERIINMFNIFSQEKERVFSEISKLQKYDSLSQDAQINLLKEMDIKDDVSSFEYQDDIDQRLVNLQVTIGATVIRYIEDVENTAEYLQEIDSIHDSKASRITRELIVTFIGAITGMLIYKYLLS